MRDDLNDFCKAHHINKDDIDEFIRAKISQRILTSLAIAAKTKTLVDDLLREEIKERAYRMVAELIKASFYKMQIIPYNHSLSLEENTKRLIQQIKEM